MNSIKTILCHIAIGAAVILILAAIAEWRNYEYDECLKVGHSAPYCFVNR